MATPCKPHPLYPGCWLREERRHDFILHRIIFSIHHQNAAWYRLLGDLRKLVSDVEILQCTCYGEMRGSHKREVHGVVLLHGCHAL